MSPESVVAGISSYLLQLFVEAAPQEVGRENLERILGMVSLTPSVIEQDSLSSLNSGQRAELYAQLQQALRLSYGRGARGILLRIGQRVWGRIIMGANLLEKTEFALLHWLPVPARRRRVLDLVAERLYDGGGVATVHSMDLDFLLVDQAGAAACGQSADEPICYVTLGIIQSALFWATSQEADVEEIACKATGAPACEFKVKLGKN